MSEPVFNGKINGKPVKVIVKLRGQKRQVFAKPKEADIDTVHFVRYQDAWCVHGDSANGEYYRVLRLHSIASGTFSAVQDYIRNSGLDLAILPIQESADGFFINASGSGVWFTFPSGVGDQKYFWALGKWDEWKKKSR